METARDGGITMGSPELVAFFKKEGATHREEVIPEVDAGTGPDKVTVALWGCRVPQHDPGV